MTTKRLILAIALMMGISSFTFAGTPKGEGKKDNNEESKIPNTTASKSTAGTLLYWFDTDNSGSTLSDPTGIPESQDPTDPPCDGNGTQYCARGFTEGQTTVSGGQRLPNIPVSSGLAAKYND